MKAVFLTVDVPPVFDVPKEAVALLGAGDNFGHGIEKFVRSFIPSSHWRDREQAIASINTFEPEPYKGTWSADLWVKGAVHTVTGTFRVISYLAL